MPERNADRIAHVMKTIKKAIRSRSAVRIAQGIRHFELHVGDAYCQRNPLAKRAVRIESEW